MVAPHIDRLHAQDPQTDRFPRITDDALASYDQTPVNQGERSSWFKLDTVGKKLGALAAFGGVTAGAIFGGNVATDMYREHRVKAAMEQASDEAGATQSNGFDPETNTVTLPGKPSIEDASVMEFLNMDNDQFTYNRAEQLNYAAPKLNADPIGDAKLVNDTLLRLGWTPDRQLFDRPIVEASITNNPQQIWDQISAAHAHIFDLAAKGQQDEALKLAAATADGKPLDTLLSKIDTDDDYSDNTQVALATADEEYPTAIQTGSIDGVEIGDAEALIKINIARVLNYDDQKHSKYLRLERGTADNSARWVLVKSTEPASS